MSDPRENWLVVRAASSAIAHGGVNLEQVPQLLRRLLESAAWQSFVLPTGEVVEHTHFADFVVEPAPRGLGVTKGLVRRLVEEDKVALVLLDQALQNKEGRPTVANSNGKRPTGTTEDAALRRLRKDAPELLAEVLAGHLSAHGAMVKAGFRPRTVSVPIGQPERVAAALRKHMSAEDVRLVAKLLAGD